jgi:hypothetical protein
MTTLDARISAEVDDLVAVGQRLNELITNLGTNLKGEPLAEAATWVTRLGQLIRKLYGEKSQHFASYQAALESHAFYSLHSNNYRQFTQMLGVARAIKHDIANNLLVNFRSLAQAEVFADFLEMGEYLLVEKYKDAAAVIIGTVLEDGLRKLAMRHALPITTDDGKPYTIDPLNNQLAKYDIYSKLVQKQITTWAHVRNKAAHGKYGEYTLEQVQMMLMFVQSFAAEYLQ